MLFTLSWANENIKWHVKGKLMCFCSEILWTKSGGPWQMYNNIDFNLKKGSFVDYTCWFFIKKKAINNDLMKERRYKNVPL